MSKIVIIGVPRSGKTTYAHEHYKKEDVISTDNLLDCEELKWEDRSRRVVEWMAGRSSFCIEGCDAVRGLRKFLVTYPGKIPCDEVIWFGTAQEELSKGQAGFGKGCKKIFDTILLELNGLGVGITIR